MLNHLKAYFPDFVLKLFENRVDFIVGRIQSLNKITKAKQLKSLVELNRSNKIKCLKQCFIRTWIRNLKKKIIIIVTSCNEFSFFLMTEVSEAH